jgi:hypothetical protein
MSLPSEHNEQVAFVAWFRKTFPAVRIFAIPNGGFRHKKTAADMKAEGASSGVPDLYIPAWYLWIEMKRQKGGRISTEQKGWEGYLIDLGYSHFYAYGAHDAQQKLLDFLNDRLYLLHDVEINNA